MASPPIKATSGNTGGTEEARQRALLEAVVGPAPETEPRRPRSSLSREEERERTAVARSLEDALTPRRRRREPTGSERAADQVRAILSEMDSRWQIPPTAFARELALQMIRAMTQDPESMRPLARLIAEELRRLDST